MRVVEGSVREHRYELDAAADRLVETAVSTATAGDVLYINDSLGLHKIANPSATAGACTLHLYSPPFSSCRVFLEMEHASEGCLRPVTTYHSEYGTPVVYELSGAGICDMRR